MTHATGTTTDFETLREHAVRLRREGLSRRLIRERLGIHNNDVLNRLLEGEPPPDWTRRPNAKDGLRDRARELRLRGWTYDRIQAELGCSKSSISLWVRDLPKPERRDPSEQARLAASKRWEHESAVRESARQRTKEAARRDVGPLTGRELFLTGVALYWAEGTKDKPHARRETVTFVNSDPGMIQVFLAWLDLLGVDRDRLRFGLLIHESANVEGAERYWADLTGAPRSAFYRTTLKKHNPKTVRKNVGEGYRGCLVIKVRRSADLYRRIEGAWYGIVGAALGTDSANRT
ncbi:hypothetical protein [Streptomyces sp. NPDC088785]|uniref:hypothetical protein n=1 Tax=Streptomyces sp. NPDC088785 TaxID=3365897 RepID=UPI0037F17C90